MKKINSRNNAFFKSLLNPKKSGQFLLEGIRYIKTALERGKVPTSVVFVDSIQAENLAKELCAFYRGLQQGRQGAREDLELDAAAFEKSFVALSEHLFKEITETEHSQGVVTLYDRAFFAKTMDDARAESPGADEILLVLDEIQDPGNVGTIVRTADACGISRIFAVRGTADVFSQKVVRSTAGSVLNVSVYYADREDILKFLSQNQYDIIAADMDGVRYKEVKRRQKAALVLGNEARGVHPLFLENGRRVSIPMYGGAESLNVAVAAGILMYELREEK